MFCQLMFCRLSSTMWSAWMNALLNLRISQPCSGISGEFCDIRKSCCKILVHVYIKNNTEHLNKHFFSFVHAFNLSMEKSTENPYPVNRRMIGGGGKCLSLFIWQTWQQHKKHVPAHNMWNFKGMDEQKVFKECLLAAGNWLGVTEAWSCYLLTEILQRAWRFVSEKQH